MYLDLELCVLFPKVDIINYSGLLRDKIVLCFMPFPLQSSPVDPSCECLHDGCHFVFIFPLTSPGDHQAPAQRPGSGAKTVLML